MKWIKLPFSFARHGGNYKRTFMYLTGKVGSINK